MTSTINGSSQQISIYNYLAPIPIATPEVKEEKAISGSSSSSVEEKEEIKEDKEEKEIERWARLKKHPQWQISSFGRIKNQYGNVTPHYINSVGYPQKDMTLNGRKYHFQLHILMGIAFIPNPLNKPFIDHIDGIRDNNHLSNLRWSNRVQNNQNRKKIPDDKFTSKYKGVSYDPVNKKWLAQYSQDGKLRYKQRFEDEIAAALAYNNAVKQYEPEFGWLNKVEDSEEYKEFKKRKWRKVGYIKSNSRYYGVEKRVNEFFVHVRVPGAKSKVFNYGPFKSEKEAARKYNEERIKLAGQNCKRLNIVSDEEDEVEGNNKRTRLE